MSGLRAAEEQDLTEGENQEVMKERIRRPPLFERDELFRSEKRFFDHFFGTNPALSKSIFGNHGYAGYWNVFANHFTV